MTDFTLRKWTARRAGATLRGFADVALPSGLVLAEVAVHVSDDGRRAWASPPSRPMLDRDGKQMVDDAGKRRFTPMISFTSRDVSDAFSRAVLRAVRRAHPADLAGWEDAHERGPR